MLTTMLGLLLLCLCLLFGLCSYFGFAVSRLCFGCPKKSETEVGLQKEEAATERVDDSEASASETRQDGSGASAYNYKYHVFLSFRGPDSRQGLADVLYNDMITAGIRTFRDDNELEVGDKISDLLPAIGNSTICVPIFSKTFAESAWCLSEVERMVNLEKTVMPIFYTVTPDDVKLKTEIFKQDLRKHGKKYGREQVKKWEDALKTVAKIKGQEVKNTGYAEFSKSFVKALQIKLKVKNKDVPEFRVKRGCEEEDLKLLLDTDANDVRLIGILGMAGIGKTTLAKVVFNELSAKFDCCSFLENIEDSLRRNGLEYLQKKLLKDLDPKLEHFQEYDPTTMLKRCFSHKKVLIILDDVSKRKYVDILVGVLDWFGSGSRIIITTKDRRALTKEARPLEVKEMNWDEALQLFSRHAFGEDSPPSDYQLLSNDVISHTGRLPLALEVLGSLLHGCEKEKWKATIAKLEKIPIADVHEKLKLSFDELDYGQRQIFLDISCFFFNKEKSRGIYMWEACGFFPDEGIEALVSMSLLKIKEGIFWMHDLVRGLGRALVQEKCPDEPAKWSRIWSETEALEVLKMKKGKKNVEGIMLEEPLDERLTNEEFSSFRSLRLLKLVGTELAGDFQDLLHKLRWLSWHQCPSEFAAINLSLRKLVVLDLSESFISEDWAGWDIIQVAKELKVLDLTKCCNLKRTPDLSSNKKLERLILSGCRNLAEIHSSIGELKRLMHLDLKGCFSLRGFPEELCSLEDLEVILADGVDRNFHVPESIGKLRSLIVLELHYMGISRIPRSIGGLVNLTRLSLGCCGGVHILPDAIGDMKSLVDLDLSHTDFIALPDTIGRLAKLERLSLEWTMMKELPDTIGGLKSLHELNLGGAEVSVLPNSIGQLDKLQELDLGSTRIKELPDSFGGLKSLENLSLRPHRRGSPFDQITVRRSDGWTKCWRLVSSTSNPQLNHILTWYPQTAEIERLPDTLGHLISLRKLDLRYTKVSVLPHSIGQLDKLEELDLADSMIEELPDSLGALKSLWKLSLRSCQLIRILPDCLGDLKSLIELDLSGVQVTALPDSIGQLDKLQMLYLTSTNLKELPDTMANLKSLRELNLYRTKVSVLPDFIGQLSQLRQLELGETKIEELPDSLGALKSLERLHLSSPHLRILPDWVGDLKWLRELDLSGTKISLLPESIGRLHMLLRLRLGSKMIEELPDSLGALKSLEVLDLGGSQLRILPDWVGDLSKLRVLRLDDCKISKLPGTIGKLRNLERLDARRCNLTEVPIEIGSMSTSIILGLTASHVAKFPHMVRQLNSLEEHFIEFDPADWLGPHETYTDLGALSVLPSFKLDCSVGKCTQELPPTLQRLRVKHATPETKLPDFSNLRDLQRIEFKDCSFKGVHELESLRELPILRGMVVSSCSKELVRFSCQLENLRSLTISDLESSDRVFDFSLSRNLQHLEIRNCTELVEIRGLEKLESLRGLTFSLCDFLESVKNARQMKRLDFVNINYCSKFPGL